MKTSEEKKEQVRQLSEKLIEGVKNVFSGSRYKEWLETCAKFHRYSVGNQILIAAQCPNASMVAGYNIWKTMGRSVRRGEQGIQILCPAPYRRTHIEEEKDPVTHETIYNPDGSPKMVVTSSIIQTYKIGYVFDIGQTDGRELPKLAHKLTEDVKSYDEFLKSLKEISPVPIKFENFEGDANGFYSRTSQSIVVKENLSQSQTIKTCIHEMSHALLHGSGDKDTPTREVEAESTAFIVCKYLGIDTEDYSFGYVSGWSSGRDMPELKASMETIRSTASSLIDKIDAELDRIREERMEMTKTEAEPALVPGIPFLTESTENKTENVPEKHPARHR